MYRVVASTPYFRDRVDAGARLADRLAGMVGDSPVVVAIPRGGVVVGAEVARGLEAELDVVVARKLGAPHHPELGIGAVSADNVRFLNLPLLRQLQITEEYLARVTRTESAEARRREAQFRHGLAPIEVTRATLVLVDDGLATGATMRAAARSLRARGPRRLVVAVPVGSQQACVELRQDADEIVCLAVPEPFHAVGQYYVDFGQVEDREVLRLLEENRHARVAGR